MLCVLRSHLKPVLMPVRTCSPDDSGKCKKGWQFTSNSCEREISVITLHLCATWLEYTVISELDILTPVFQDPKMDGLKLTKYIKLTKYTKIQYIKILICQARGKGSTIKELCTSFGLKRKTVERILQSKLILPAGRCPSKNKQKSILHKMEVLRSNPFLSIEQLYIRYPKIFNYCCLERVWQLTGNNQ